MEAENRDETADRDGQSTVHYSHYSRFLEYGRVGQSRVVLNLHHFRQSSSFRVLHTTLATLKKSSNRVWQSRVEYGHYSQLLVLAVRSVQ